MARPDDLALAERLADAAGDAIRPYWRSGLTGEDKADGSPVTRADRAAEAAMRAILTTERPGDGVMGEEEGATGGEAARQWVLDPIDGTVSFLAGRPLFATLIALTQDGWPTLGLIDQPIARERWTGAAGQPTRLNGAPVRTRACPSLAAATLASTSPTLFTDEEAAGFLRLTALVARPRIVWGGDATNYALLASGHLDLVVEAGLKPHDWAALVPVVEGAGGLMCDWRGEPLSLGSAGDVLALGDPARLEEVVDALAG